MAFKMRTSKFRHVFGKEYKKDQCYDGIKISKISADTKFCSVNPKFLAVMCESGGGGSFLVMPLSKVGRVERDVPLVSGHSAAVMDIKWCPHDENIIASASEDCTVRLWKIPDEGLVTALTEDVATLREHQKRVNLIEWHPTAKFILLSCGLDNKINIWNCINATVIRSYNVADMVYSVSFNYDGSRFATTLKNKQCCIYSSQNTDMITEFCNHDGKKPSMCAYAKDDKIITTGFSRMSERQYAVYDLNKKERICREQIDNNNGTLQVEYDIDTGLIFLWGKGDSIIRYYEITDEAPYMHYLSLYQAKESQRGMGWMAKRGLNVKSCEIARCYKLWNTGLCEVIPFTVPRKSDLFQEDLYPDTASNEASISAEEFEAGKICGPRLISLKSGFVSERKEPVSNKSSLLADKPKTKLSQMTSQEPTPTKPAPVVHKPAPVEKATSNGSQEPPAPAPAPAPAPTPAPAPAQTGPALPAGFDAEQMMKDMADLKTIIKRQDKKIESLEKRVGDLEVTSEENEPDCQEDNKEFEDCQE